MTSSAAQEREARIASLPLEQIGRYDGIFRGSLRSVADIWSRRELLSLLVRREIKARYKDSSLGVLWSLVRPLAQLLIYYFIIGQVLGVARGVPSFAIFVFVGITVWSLYSEIVQNGTASIITNAGLVKKVYLPREIFPLASVGAGMFTFAIQLVILIAATLILGEPPLTLDLLYLFPSLAVVIILASSFAILLSAANVYLRDFEHLVEVALVVFFWASPIVYSFKFLGGHLEGWMLDLYLANPVTLAVLGMQKAFWVAGSSDSANFPDLLLLRLGIGILGSLVFLWISQRVFARLQGNFAQEL